MLINQLNDKLVDEKSKRNFKKLMDIWEYEKLALYNEFTEKVALNQKQVGCMLMSNNTVLSFSGLGIFSEVFVYTIINTPLNISINASAICNI